MSAFHQGFLERIRALPGVQEAGAVNRLPVGGMSGINGFYLASDPPAPGEMAPLLETRGVTMFMTLPGPRNALDAWDSMLATSRRLAELLHADLLDDQHKVFTRERSLQIKEELREFDRQNNPVT